MEGHAAFRAHGSNGPRGNAALPAGIKPGPQAIYPRRLPQQGKAPLKAHFDTANGAGALALVYATVAGFTIQEWAALAALVYSLILIGEKVWKGFKAWRAKRGP